MWNLLAIRSSWDGCSLAAPRHEAYRVNKHNSELVTHEVSESDLKNVPSIFKDVKEKLEGRCVDLQFIFGGSFPKELGELGFIPRRDMPQIWNLNHPSYRIAAIWIETTNKWILSILKRNGLGVLSDATSLDVLVLEESVRQMDLSEVVIS